MKQKYQEYLKLNKNVFLGFLGSVIISAIAADYFGDQADYLNSSFTLIIDYVLFVTNRLRTVSSINRFTINLFSHLYDYIKFVCENYKIV